MADRVVVTADNSRHEDTAAIIDAVVAGARDAAPALDAVIIEPDRRLAIGHAVGTAAPGDVVVIAGKGHETTQTIGDTVFPFDDREVARQAVHRLGHRSEGGSSP